MENKECFVISSICSTKSDIRNDVDLKYDFVYKPVMIELGYSITRSDNVDLPGSISVDIVRRLISADLVIADISDENPNVFYELSIRNAVMKPVIIFRNVDQKIPFDIQDTRAISIDMTDPRIWENSKNSLKIQVLEAEKDPEGASTSILSQFSKEIHLDSKSPLSESDILFKLTSISDDLKFLKNKDSFFSDEEKLSIRHPIHNEDSFSSIKIFYNNDPILQELGSVLRTPKSRKIYQILIKNELSTKELGMIIDNEPNPRLPNLVHHLRRMIRVGLLKSRLRMKNGHQLTYYSAVPTILIIPPSDNL